MSTPTTIEDGLVAWVKAATALPDGQVIFSDQTAHRPDAPFATIRLDSLTPVGAVDEIWQDFDVSRPVGFEVSQLVNGVREAVVTVQFFTPGVTDSSTARVLASTLQTSLRLPSLRQGLANAGLTPFDAGVVSNLTTLVGTKFESRALCQFRFYTLSQATEFTTWIETCVPTPFTGPPDSGTLENIDLP